MHQIKISVRELIEYVLRSGDISAVFLSSKRMSDGVKAHQKFQKAAGETYEQEVSISHEVEYEDVHLLLSGRMDGLIRVDDIVLIDEIKSTGRSLDDLSGDHVLHWAQVWMYAYMYAHQEGLKQVITRLTYIELESFKIKQFEALKTFEELEVFFYEVIHKYVGWAKKQNAWQEVSRASMRAIEFPFGDYRKGQKQLMSSVYKTIEEKKILFSRAPTGIGKTIATLFPAIKSLGHEKCDKIFYLTAKSIGKEVVVDTLGALESKGLMIKRVVITAKDKTCLNTKKACNPEECPYARGHFDRINEVLEKMYVEHHLFNREVIERYAEAYRVCPYELSLDLALFCDVIICDYNYVFDPSAMLKRFFLEETERYVLLIDEAHNLVDRAREMYSATLDKQKVMTLKKKVKDIDARLYKYFNQLNKVLIERRKKCDQQAEGCYSDKEMPEDCEEALRGILFRTEKIFPLHKKWEHMDELLDFYFDSYDFVKKSELYDEKYITYNEKTSRNFQVKMFCMDPSRNIQLAIGKMQGVVYFSATLLPMNYYVSILGGDETSYGLSIPSPFDREKLCLLIDKSVSTKFARRENSIQPIVDKIDQITNPKKGNYMVFFPSYKYMTDVYETYMDQYDSVRKEVIIQSRALDEGAKEEFIGAFHTNRDKTLIAFVVLGGMFGEGIDLTGEKLSGAIIVSVGLPQICYERNLIKRHFDVISGSGYEYAYVYPGLNKVMQSAGRVIRTVNDQGLVVLIDERFNQPYYQSLFPQEWQHPLVLKKEDDLERVVEAFWKDPL